MTALHDLRYAVKGLARSPLFTAVAVLTFALGIGATTTVFSLVKGVLLNPLPYPEPERLVLVWETSERMQAMAGIREIPASPGMAEEWRKAASFEYSGAFRTLQANVSNGLETDRVRGAAISDGVLGALQVQPVLGRAFDPGEYMEGRNKVVLLSHRLWRTRFNSDRGILGRTVRMDNESVVVAGVMPEGFVFPRGTESRRDKRGIVESLFWRPLVNAPLGPNRFGNHNLGFVARLKPGVTAVQAGAEIAAIESQVLSSIDASMAKEFGATVVPYLENMVKDSRPVLAMLSVAVGLVLLVACVNLAGLLVVRQFSQQKEIAVRAALGAGPGHLARHVLLESMILGLAGCAAGVLFAYWGVAILRGIAGSRIPRLDAVAVDPGVLGFALLVSVCAAAAFGLLPAVRLRKLDLAGALKSGGRTGSAAGQQRLRTALVTVEVALSMVLLTGAGLLARSFWEVLRADRGFDVANVLTMRLPIPTYRYPQVEQRRAFVQRISESVGAMPQVETVGLVHQLPLTGEADIHALTIEGQTAKAGQEPVAELRYVNPGYFSAIRLPLKQGRLPGPADSADAQAVAVLNEVAAAKFWPGESALGKRIRTGERDTLPWVTIVGIVANARQARVDQDPGPLVFIPFTQAQFTEMALAVRTRTDPEQLAAAVREQVRRLDAEQPVLQVKTLTAIADEATTDRRLQTTVLLLFALFALLVAALGLHGVIAYSANQRAREFAIRLALGAERGNILRMILGEAFKIAVAGLAVGAVCSLALSRLLQALLYKVQAADGLTFAAVSALLVACCLAASLQPALRAMRVDPVRALNEA